MLLLPFDDHLLLPFDDHFEQAREEGACYFARVVEDWYDQKEPPPPFNVLLVPGSALFAIGSCVQRLAGYATGDEATTPEPTLVESAPEQQPEPPEKRLARLVFIRQESSIKVDQLPGVPLLLERADELRDERRRARWGCRAPRTRS